MQSGAWLVHVVAGGGCAGSSADAIVGNVRVTASAISVTVRLTHETLKALAMEREIVPTPCAGNPFRA